MLASRSFITKIIRAERLFPPIKTFAVNGAPMADNWQLTCAPIPLLACLKLSYILNAYVVAKLTATIIFENCDYTVTLFGYLELEFSSADRPTIFQ